MLMMMLGEAGLGQKASARLFPRKAQTHMVSLNLQQYVYWVQFRLSVLKQHDLRHYFWIYDFTCDNAARTLLANSSETTHYFVTFREPFFLVLM